MKDKKITLDEITTGITKCFIDSCPLIGPIINEVFFEIPSRVAQRRQNEFIKDVAHKLEAIKHELIDLEYIQSEEFSDLLQVIRNNIILRKASEKADFFCSLTVASMLNNRPSDPIEWQERYIEIIADLNKSEMRLLEALKKHKNPSSSSVKGFSTPFGIEKKEFELSFDSLISKGLAYDASLSGMPRKVGVGTGHMPNPRDRINISPLAKAAIAFIPEVETIVKNASSSIPKQS